MQTGQEQLASQSALLRHNQWHNQPGDDAEKHGPTATDLSGSTPIHGTMCISSFATLVLDGNWRHALWTKHVRAVAPGDNAQTHVGNEGQNGIRGGER